jgi:hypothetical protein
MKFIRCFFMLLLMVSISSGWSAQNVGINGSGAAPNASAMLDVSSTTKGVLLPQVALTAYNTAGPTTSPATGLIVYNTATVGSVPNNLVPGYYYNSGTPAAPIWKKVYTGAPYGDNVQYAISDGSTNPLDISIGGGAGFANMSGMSITFTPVHSVVFLSFSASGATSNEGSAAFVECRLMKGATVLAGTVSLSDESDGGGGTDAAWNCNMYIPVTVTPGVSITLNIQWEYAGTSTSNNAYCNTSTAPNYSHRSLVILD